MGKFYNKTGIDIRFSAWAIASPVRGGLQPLFCRRSGAGTPHFSTVVVNTGASSVSVRPASSK